MGSGLISFDPKEANVNLQDAQGWRPMIGPDTRVGSRDQASIQARPDATRLGRRTLRQPHETELEALARVLTASTMSIKARRKNRYNRCLSPRSAADKTRLRRRYAHAQLNTISPSSIPWSSIDILLTGSRLFPHDLAALTTIYHTVIALDIIRSETSDSSGLVVHPGGKKAWSGRCLDDALRCLFSKTKSILAPNSAVSEAAILGQYARALASLQAAVNSPRWSDPEVLCAISILALFELFHSPNRTCWSHHMSGAAKLIQLRGPESFTTNFDTAIFRALYPAFGLEWILNGMPCFLDEEPWQKFMVKVYRSEEPLADDGLMMRKYAINMTQMPSLESRIIDVLQRGLDAKDEEVMSLVEKARYLNQQGQEWKAEFTHHMAATKCMGSKLYDSAMTVFAAGMTFHLLTCMYLAALDPSVRLAMIDEAVWHAREMKNAQRELSPIEHGPAYYVAQKTKFSEATLCVAPIWREAVGSSDLLESWRFHIWLLAIRKLHTQDFSLDDINPGADWSTQPLNSKMLVKFGFGLLTLDP